MPASAWASDAKGGGASVKYQPEIDGLRAIAVVPVVLFHSGLPGFQGGYVGVDVFFVISGFLITGIIAADIAAGRFSIFNFYERRVRRIIPALMTVLIATLVAGIALFLPYQLASLARASLAAIAFVSNFWFWSHSGYFAGSAALEPLIHTWSLAVEEQFYLFFPVGMWLLHRWRLPLLPAVVIVLIASLGLAVVLVHRVPSAAFYLLPTRTWELMIGAALSLGAVPPVRSRSIRELLCVGGLALIAWPVFTYTPETVFPGASALPPCLGAAAIILAGRDGGGLATRAVGSRPLVGIGLISYSLYLWHWPIFVFSRQVLLTETLPKTAVACAITAALFLAWASWNWIEAPFRNRLRFPRSRLFFATAAMAATACGTAAVSANGLPQRFAPEVLRIAAGKDDIPPLVDRCLGLRGAQSCPVGAPGAPSFAIWGDSHAAAVGDGIGIAARRAGRAGVLYAFNGCPPGEGAPSPTLPPPDQARCAERNHLILQKIAHDHRINTVVLVAFWGNYLSRVPGPLLTALDGSIALLQKSKHEVVIVAGAPAPGFDVPFVLAQRRSRGAAAPPFPAPAASVDPRLNALARRHSVRILSLSDAFCRATECRLEIGGRPLFFDGNHVSGFANEALIAPAVSDSGLLNERLGVAKR